MRTLIIFLGLFFFGCTYETNAIESDDMGKVYSTPEQWGQEKTFTADSFKPNQVQVVLTRDPPREGERKLPQTSTIICGVTNEDVDATQNYNLRWVLRPGVGGARTEVRFDAVGFTRLALPLEAFTLGLVVEPWDSGSDVPAGVVDAFAFVGEGGVTGGEAATGPTFTEFFEVDATAGAASIIIELPEGATAFRVIGSPTGGGITSPFSTTFGADFIQGSTVRGAIAGLGAAPGDPSLFTLYASGNWFPLPGSLTAFQLHNTGAGTKIRGMLQFKIDL